MQPWDLTARWWWQWWPSSSCNSWPTWQTWNPALTKTGTLNTNQPRFVFWKCHTLFFVLAKKKKSTWTWCSQLAKFWGQLSPQCLSWLEEDEDRESQASFDTRENKKVWPNFSLKRSFKTLLLPHLEGRIGPFFHNDFFLKNKSSNNNHTQRRKTSCAHDCSWNRTEVGGWFSTTARRASNHRWEKNTWAPRLKSFWRVDLGMSEPASRSGECTATDSWVNDAASVIPEVHHTPSYTFGMCEWERRKTKTPFLVAFSIDINVCSCVVISQDMSNHGFINSDKGQPASFLCDPTRSSLTGLGPLLLALWVALSPFSKPGRKWKTSTKRGKEKWNESISCYHTHYNKVV